jgi:hypothetical protein
VVRWVRLDPDSIRPVSARRVFIDVVRQRLVRVAEMLVYRREDVRSDCLEQALESRMSAASANTASCADPITSVLNRLPVAFDVNLELLWGPDWLAHPRGDEPDQVFMPELLPRDQP